MEVWKDIRGYEGLYQVSNLGNVRRSKQESTGRLLNPYVNSHGYLTVGLSKNGVVSRETVQELEATIQVLEQISLMNLKKSRKEKSRKAFQIG